MTGFLHVGDGAAIEPEVDLTGHWIDGDVFHLGEIRVGAGARVGARSTLAPGRRSCGANAEVAPGSLVVGEVPAAEYWSGSPAEQPVRARPRPVARAGAAAGPRLAARVRRDGGR